jgi:hypothetical protein
LISTDDVDFIKHCMLLCRNAVHTKAVGIWKPYAPFLRATIRKELRAHIARLAKMDALPFMGSDSLERLLQCLCDDDDDASAPGFCRTKNSDTTVRKPISSNDVQHCSAVRNFHSNCPTGFLDPEESGQSAEVDDSMTRLVNYFNGGLDAELSMPQSAVSASSITQRVEMNWYMSERFNYSLMLDLLAGKKLLRQVPAFFQSNTVLHITALAMLCCTEVPKYNKQHFNAIITTTYYSSQISSCDKD